VELLSNIRTPAVSEVTARSALLSWGPPIRIEAEPAAPAGGAAGGQQRSPGKFDAFNHILERDFRYEVLLSDKGRDGKYRPIFTGCSIDCRLTDLRPCTEYHIRIHALYDVHRGE